MKAIRQFHNGKTKQLEVMLEPVLYHDTFPPTRNGWTVWCIDLREYEHFDNYNKALDRYQELVTARI